MPGEEHAHLVSLAGKAADNPRKGKRPRPRRHRYWRRHTPHYYIVLSGVGSAAGGTVLDAVAYEDKSPRLAEIAFGATSFTALLIYIAFFWGFYLLMNWRIPAGRIKYFIPHGIVGTLSPLIYVLNVSLQLDVLGKPLPGWALILSLVTLGLLCVQFAMGKVVVHVSPLRVIRGQK